MTLNRRQNEVIQLVWAGFSRKQISEKLGISVNTVNVYWKEVMHKLEANNTAHALRLACEHGFIQGPDTDANLRKALSIYAHPMNWHAKYDSVFDAKPRYTWVGPPMHDHPKTWAEDALKGKRP